MNNFSLSDAIRNVSDAYPDFIISVENSCRNDKDVRDGLIKFLQENPSATTSDILEEKAHLKGISYYDPAINDVAYKYPQFKYKSDKHEI